MINKESLESLLSGNVLDEAGNKIGGVGQIYLDDETGNPSWVTVKTGWFGSSETFVPLDNARIEGDDIVVPYAEAMVKDAPRIDVDQHLDVAQEEELYRYYGQSYTAREGYVAEETTVADADRADYVADADRADYVADADRVQTDRDGITLHEERLNVGTQEREVGRARLRKYVTEEQQSVTVPVRKEEVRVVREDLNERAVAGDIDANGAEEIEVSLREEVPVIEKETVATERVGLEKVAVETQQQVTDTVRKEHLDTDGVEVDRTGEGYLADGEIRDGRSLGDKIEDATDFNNDGQGIAGETKDALDTDNDGKIGR